MPTNNFKLFDENKSNILTDTDYESNTQRLNGVQSGIASSQLQNKTLYQTTLMAYAMAQMMNAQGFDASDSLAVSTFVSNYQEALKKITTDITSAIDAKITELNSTIAKVEGKLLKIKYGNYTGSATSTGASKKITVGFTPEIVLIFNRVNNAPTGSFAGFAIKGYFPIDSYNSSDVIISIVTNGFNVYQRSNSGLNLSSYSYNYLAIGNITTS